MKASTILFIAAGVAALGGVGWYYKRQYDLAQQYDISLDSVKIDRITVDTTTLTLSLKVVNVSNLSANISNVNLNVYVNGQYAGNAYQQATQIIAAHGTTFISVDVIVKNDAIGMNVLTLINNNNAPIELKFDGSVKIGTGFLGVTIPVSENQTMHLSDFR